MADEKQTGAIWFVRGVPAELREEVKRAAEHSGVTIGRVVSDALRRHLSATLSDAAPAGFDSVLGSGLAELRQEVTSLRDRVDLLEGHQMSPNRPAPFVDRENTKKAPPAKNPALPSNQSAQHEAAARIMAEIEASGASMFVPGRSGDVAGRRLSEAGEAAVLRLFAELPSLSAVARLVGTNRATVKRVVGAGTG